MDELVKPAGTYENAEDWIKADKAWQLATFQKKGNRPRLDAPPPNMFPSEKIRAAAIAGRLILCDKPDHLEPGESDESRFNTMEMLYKTKTCKKCQKGVGQKKRDEAYVVYETAEKFMDACAAKKCKEYPKMTIGYCPMPTPKMFTDKKNGELNQLQFDRALHLRDVHNKKYHQQLNEQEAVKKRKNKNACGRYAANKETAEGRKRIHDKMVHDQENKMARKKKALDEGMDYCGFGSHAVDPSEMIFCPAADLGITDFKGKLGRVRRGACKAHYHRVLQKWNSFRHKYRSDVALRIRFRLEWWRSEVKKRGKTISLTEDEQTALVTSPCAYCGAEATDAVPNGIDLLDQLWTDYAHDTCVSCCTLCNMTKRALLPEDYVAKCKDITLFQTSGVCATRFIPFRQVRGAGADAVATLYYNTGSYNKYKYDASRRKIEFALTMEEFMQKKREGCTYCGLRSPVHIGIDRIDNALAYTFDNTCGSCTTCNMMKWTTDKSEFLNLCARVSAQSQA